MKINRFEDIDGLIRYLKAPNSSAQDHAPSQEMSIIKSAGSKSRLQSG
jgi:hypothetical protein